MTKRKGTFDVGLDVRKLIGDTPTSRTDTQREQKNTLETEQSRTLISNGKR